MNRASRIVFCALVLVVVAAWWIQADDATYEVPAVRLGSVLGDGEDAGFQRADPAYRLDFPTDHGAHPDFRSEWWYFTGNLGGEGGERYGFQFTIFRFALGPEHAERSSAWGTRQVWMGHLAVTDAGGGRFFHAERFARGGAMGLAGAQARPFRVWLDDWSMTSAGDGLFPLRLVAADGGFGLELEIDDDRGPVLQGDDGYSRKGPGAGNASHYYSYTRLATTGRLTLGAEVREVTGEAWLDREWSTSALGPGVDGWDWFALQLDDDSEIMFYRLRRADGSADPLSAGTLTSGSSPPAPLGTDVKVESLRSWTSPRTGIRYPVSWRLLAPSRGFDLRVDALLDEQEMATAVRYWEGAVSVRGTRAGREVTGLGYLEMTGYDTRSDP